MRRMDQQPRQSGRRGGFSSLLDEDELVLRRFSGQEALSELFAFDVDASSVKARVDFDRILGTACKVSIVRSDGGTRYFNGVLTEVHSLGQEERMYRHRLVLRPWLWLLSKTGDCRIFKNAKVTDIIARIFGLHAFADFEDKTQGSYPELEYCVQYCESDFAFVSRLMEENGIYYYFDHADGTHRLIMVDTPAAHPDRKGGADIAYSESHEKHWLGREVLTQWRSSRQFATGRFAQNDFNYMTPSKSLRVDDGGHAAYRNASLEMFTYPGRYDEDQGGEVKTRALLEAEQALDKRSAGWGDAASLSPGEKIKLQGHPDVADGSEFLIVRASHSFDAGAYHSGGGQSGEVYSGSYEFLPADIQFRAPARTPKPRIMGPQTAFVCGEGSTAGDGEIHVDELGRILVMFHWAGDLSRRDTKVPSRWVRIAHGWASRQWGDIKIPRVGMEVVVEFLNGDPDQPLVTGSVYNDEARPPYDLPDKKTISGTKSQTLGGTGYNEFIFDDESNNELVRLHAQRDMEAKIENDERRDIGNDRTETVGAAWKVTAGDKITFICGQSSITMTPTTITIASLNINVEAQAQLKLTSVQTTMQSAGPTAIQAMPLKLN
jgi:type VI secretion system secreted protein VgrG